MCMCSTNVSQEGAVVLLELELPAVENCLGSWEQNQGPLPERLPPSHFCFVRGSQLYVLFYLCPSCNSGGKHSYRIPILSAQFLLLPRDTWRWVLIGDRARPTRSFGGWKSEQHVTSSGEFFFPWLCLSTAGVTMEETYVETTSQERKSKS